MSISAAVNARRTSFGAMMSVGLCLLLSSVACAKIMAAWDFTKGVPGWKGNPHVKGLTVTPEGLAFQSTGNDPWIEGPAVDLPAEGMVRVTVRMKSDAGPSGELFYGRTFQAGRSVRFAVKDDSQWHEYALPIAEAPGPGTRFRLDPAAGAGHIVVSSIVVETLAPIPPPPFERPRKTDRTTARPRSVSSGPMTLEHYQGWGDFVVTIAGAEMAAGYGADLIGVILDEKPQWLQLAQADSTCEQEIEGALVSRAVLKDSANGRWQITRRFQTGPQMGTLSVENEFVVDQDREVLYLPWLTLFPGLGTFGERKAQGLFAGLEYLDDEPSSSQADLTTPEHIRRAPDPIKITFPLMALAHGGRYIGLIWEPSDVAAAIFDSPDRIFHSGAHVMALTAPAVGPGRLENHLTAHTPFTLRANRPLRLRATIIGGPGGSIVPAVQKYLELNALPDVPPFKGGLDAAVTLLAHGWLDSTINEGGLFRHAVWGDSFRAGPAADAVMYMDWLAHHVPDRGLADRLHQGRDLALTRLPAGQSYSSAVSHTRTPSAPLVFGRVPLYVEQRKAEAQNLLKQFDEQGIKLYRPGKVDYGKTHFARHANGLAAADVARILETATLSADPQLIEQGIVLLDKQTVLYANTVPRGAQTWEIPLHTPDILASAHLVKAYTLGYVLSGRPEHLEQARYWAWTGVPFVYLVHPTQGEVGPYATIAVLGATNWQAPVWLGLPVQWCGLVYASALHRLSQYDKEVPWATIAKGISATGLQMTWPTSEAKRQGLLPDIFHLQAQLRDGPAINPGTVQAHVPELFGQGMLYDMKKLPRRGWLLHAPCVIHEIDETPDSLSFTVGGWNGKAFHVLLCGVEQPPADLTIRPLAPTAGGQAPQKQSQVDFRPPQRLLVLTLQGAAQVQLRFPRASDSP